MDAAFCVGILALASAAATEVANAQCSIAIIMQPTSLAVCASGTGMFSVAGTFSGGLPSPRWQWQPNGAAGEWADLANGNNSDASGEFVIYASGAETYRLVIQPLDQYFNSAPKAFRCVVTSECASDTSTSAMLVVCPGDLDNDGNVGNGRVCDSAVDINDLLFFLGAFEAGDSGVDLDDDGDPAAAHPDGGVDISDLLFFLAHFEAGC